MPGSPLGLTNESKVNKYVFAQSNGKVNKVYYNPGGKGEAPGSPNKTLSSKGPNHNSDDYDTSISSILKYLQGYNSMYLPSAAFAYNKDLGVYPNNRLMIARRFAGPIGDDLTQETHKPISSVVGWVKDDDMSNAVSISFGEKWTNSIPSGIMDLLNDMVTEMTGGGMSLDAMQGQLGSAGGEGGEAAPGYTTILQFTLLKAMGLTDRSSKNLPQGDPNYVYAAKMREVGKNIGINCSIKVKMEVEYEQKFINNVDPTDVWMDIINNILRFGGSPSTFYLEGESEKANKLFELFQQGRWGDAIAEIIDLLLKALTDLLAQIGEFAEQIGEGGELEGIKDTLTNIGNAVGGFLASIYRVKIQAVISALTGQPSTPWHVTIGNPKRPFFVSGDMVCSDVDLSFGDVFAFNDLPATIKASFTLENARPLGIQEIMKKFSGAYGVGRKYKPGLRLITDIEKATIEGQKSDTNLQDEFDNSNNSTRQNEGFLTNED